MENKLETILLYFRGLCDTTNPSHTQILCAIDKELYQLNKLENIEKELLNLSAPILRKFMSSNEIKVANRLVKKGKLQKGISDEKNGTTQFYK